MSSDEIYEEKVNALLEEIEDYDGPEWIEEVGEENFRHDNGFAALELQEEYIQLEEVLNLGRYLEAKSIAEKNHGDSYELTFEL